jgi:guanosine-3',5'-bis(diphosphate) 3'-pyrophosphohydrolase
MSNLELAILIATIAHAGQVDKAGQPYILHPLRVMLRLSTEPERIAAVLHDVLEDCRGWTLERLRGHFGPEVASAVDALTRREGETYRQYILRAAADPIARAVKVADLHDNLDPSRPPEPSLEKRYLRALADLTPFAPTKEEVQAGMTAKGGFTKAQLAAWGVPWPPPKGWRKSLEARMTQALPGTAQGAASREL